MRIATVFGCIFVICIGHVAWAYNLQPCTGGYQSWYNGEPWFYIEANRWPEGSDIHESMEDMIMEFRGNSSFPGTDIYCHHGNFAGAGTFGDSQNQVRAKTNWPWSPDDLAKTRLSVHPFYPCRLFEADIMFNFDDYDASDFTTDPPGWPGTESSISPYTSRIEYGDAYSYPSIMLHEMGHAVGLKHSNGYPDNMNSLNPGGTYSGFDDDPDDLYYYLQEDTREALRYLYSDNSTGASCQRGHF